MEEKIYLVRPYRAPATGGSDDAVASKTGAIVFNAVHVDLAEDVLLSRQFAEKQKLAANSTVGVIAEMPFHSHNFSHPILSHVVKAVNENGGYHRGIGRI